MTLLQAYIAVLSLAILERVIAQVTDKNVQACNICGALSSYCVSVSPELAKATTFAPSAPCLCYVSTAWAPDVWDNYLASCYSYYSTASPALVASVTSLNHGPLPTDPCRRAGNVLGATKTLTDTELSISSPTDPGIIACNTVNGILSNCERVSPGFATLTDTNRIASCMCYSGLAWKPSVFDDAWGTCLRFYSTAAPSAYFSLTASGIVVTTPCARAGDVRAGSTSSMPSSTSRFVSSSYLSLNTNLASEVFFAHTTCVCMSEVRHRLVPLHRQLGQTLAQHRPSHRQLVAQPVVPRKQHGRVSWQPW
jgi:hypothetical protein